jgi:hypothetical protein
VPCVLTLKEAHMDINPALDTTHHCPFTQDELHMALSQVKDSTTGRDDISYTMLINLPLKGKEILLKQFNNIWRTGNFPSSWKEIIVKPIPEPGKPRNEIKSYRSIALISCIVKTFEMLITYTRTYTRKKNTPLNYWIPKRYINHGLFHST